MKTNIKLNKGNINQEVILAGWIKKSRRLGDLIFIDLRNTNGIVQLVINKDNENYDEAKSLRSEDVIEITGTVIERKKKNPDIYSGEIEIQVNDLKLISKATKQTPLIIDEVTDALEPVRMEYRYLDIRRPNVTSLLVQRSKFINIMRNFFHELEFIEVETPIITRPTPGGAGELKVKSVNHENKYYSLVQSPQIYKQLLMYGGIDKYFQIAKCFRDEDSRSDRQLEFTQLDLEMSFIKEEDIQNLIEKLLVKLFKEIKGIKLSDKFPKITYAEAMGKYGSDKPDTRIKNFLSDITNIFESTEINFIKDLISKNNKVISVAFEQEVKKNFIKKLEETAKMQGASGLGWLKLEDGSIVDGSTKAFNDNEIKFFVNKYGKNTTIFFIIEKEKIAREIIGRIRLDVAKELELLNSNIFNFLWVVDWPMFEKTDEGYEAIHNPFTAVKEEQELEMLNGEIENLVARGYDIVLNGSEIGGGSIRFNKDELQQKAFEIIGLSKEDMQKHFGWFLNAQKYGIPYHGGIALGIDRILSIMFNQESIREIIAFPKSTSGVEEMSKTPIEEEK